MSEKSAAQHPIVAISINDNGEVTLNGDPVKPGPEGTDPRHHAVHTVARQVAQPLRRAVRVVATDPHGQKTNMVVHPDGHTSDVDQLDRPDQSNTRDMDTEEGLGEATQADLDVIAFEQMFGTSEDTTSQPTTNTEDVDDTRNPFGGPALPPTPAPSPDPVQRKAKPEHREPARARHSFLDDTKPVEVADSGWRGFLARLGIKVAPSPEELSRREDERSVARHWQGPRTIAIVNGKGGAGKTPTTVILSALFARYGGSGVLAWDNNETRGTLGWRTEQGPHDASVLDLLPSTESLMAPTARASDLAAYVHHQTADKFDVLRSNPQMVAAEQRLTAEDFNSVHAVGAKYFRLIFVDSGNDESAPHWLRMIDQADQVVVATTTRPDHAEAGILLLDELRSRSAHGQKLADNAVVIVAQADKEEAAAQHIAQGFDGAARVAVTIPYDRAMRSGWLQLDHLQPATRRAYLRAAAAVADGL